MLGGSVRFLQTGWYCHSPPILGVAQQQCVVQKTLLDGMGWTEEEELGGGDEAYQHGADG